MAQRKLLITAGIFTFAVGATLMLPANIAYSWFAPPSVRLSGVEGTLWRGRASEGTANGAYFSDLSWAVRPLRIFTGKAAFDIAVRSIAGPVSGNVALGFGNNVVFKDFSGQLGIANLHPGFRSNRIDGSVDLAFRSITLQDGFPSHADGAVTVANLTIGLLGNSPVGDFRALVSDSDDGLIALVEDTRAVVSLRGTLQLKADRSYTFIGKVGATPDTPPQINQNLQYLGTPDANGQHDFRFEGSL